VAVDAELDPFALVSATEAAAIADVTVGAVCNWNSRGYLPIATDERGREIRDSRGRPRYRLLDVAKTELEMKKRQRGVRNSDRIAV
jgi:hypothetical protein